MADVSKILKPRRGLASTMATAAKSGIVLAKGELFVEAPSTGMGTGASKVKIGDGTTAYSALPYALGDTSNDKIAFSSNTSTTVAAALNSVASGNSLKTLIAGLKQAISLCNTSITQLNDDTAGLKFAQDAEGNWGYIIPGADTVNPFKSGESISGFNIYIDVLIYGRHDGHGPTTINTSLVLTYQDGAFIQTYYTGNASARYNSMTSVEYHFTITKIEFI